jgi:hypothetical protein
MSPTIVNLIISTGLELHQAGKEGGKLVEKAQMANYPKNTRYVAYY